MVTLGVYRVGCPARGLVLPDDFKAILEKRAPYSQRYLVLGLAGLVGLVGLGLPLLLRLGLVGLVLWLVSGIALNKYRCEYGTRFSRLPTLKWSPNDRHISGVQQRRKTMADSTSTQTGSRNIAVYTGNSLV